jgi:hypothetical protein
MMKKVDFIMNVCLILINLFIESIESDNDSEWKPDENSPCANDIGDESSEESERDLTNQEAAKFIKGSTNDCHGSVIKKPRIQDEDEN